jgi:hypothetical protein
MQMKTGPLHKPALDYRWLVGTVVIENEMDVQRFRYGSIDGIEEPAELGRGMPMMNFTGSFPRFSIERGKMRKGTKARVRFPVAKEEKSAPLMAQMSRQ